MTNTKPDNTLLLDEQFQAAQQEVSGLLPIDDKFAMLKFYALYKQASLGDIQGKKPGMTQMVKRVKWEAWEKLKGMPTTDAKSEYIKLVEKFKK